MNDNVHIHAEQYTPGLDQNARTPQSTLTKATIGAFMAQYLVAIHHPDNYEPSSEDKTMHRDIDSLNDEMVAAGKRVFVGGLQSAGNAMSVRVQPDGMIQTAEGSYLQTNEHVGGFWVVEAHDMDEALEWGRKAAVACRAPVEVRRFN